MHRLLLTKFNVNILFDSIGKDILQFILTSSHHGTFRVIPEKMDRVKFALGGTYAAAHTMIRINDGRAAGKTSGRLFLNLGLCKDLLIITEGSVISFFLSGNLPAGIIVVLYPDIILVQRNIIILVSSDS